MDRFSFARARFRAEVWRFAVRPGNIIRVKVPEDLVEHLVRSSPLTAGEARRVVADVVEYFSESVPEYVRRRHTELQGRGLTNESIFTTLAGELTVRRFAAPELSLRQLRRLVYG